VDNNFIDTGGDNYAMLVQSPPAAWRDVMADVLIEYIRGRASIAPATLDRITAVP
jgi:hypothetical protein